MIPRKDVEKLVGKPFIDEQDGYAWGCLAPMYEILPETLKFRYPVVIVMLLHIFFLSNYQYHQTFVEQLLLIILTIF